MLEIPESATVSRQLNQAVAGKKISGAVANSAPHGLAWYFGDPALYPALLVGRRVEAARPVGGQVEIAAEGATLLFNDGVCLRLYGPGEKRPEKHQLLLTFEDGSALVGTVRMYGGLMAFPDGANDSFYYRVALEKPSPLTDGFDEAYFGTIVAAARPTLSVKALLATEQRVPGLGNGVLQDILFHAGLHPARALRTLDDVALSSLFRSVKGLLRQMTNQGGRDTEPDLYGKPGGYPTALSRKTWTFPCPRCGGAIQRKAYLGGNVYFCPVCQPPAIT